MSVMARSMAFGRHGAGTVSKSSHMTLRHETESYLGMTWGFETSKSAPQ